MDYYGYFPTFNSLIVETQIIVTLIGFLAVIFIFWYRHIYETEMPKGRKNTKQYEEQSKNTQKKLTVVTFGFFLITVFGIFILLDNISTLQTLPYTFENLTAQNKPIPDFYWNRLDSRHQNFIIWIFSTLFYFMILTLTTLDVFKEEVKKESITKKEEKKKIKSEGENVQKIKKKFRRR